MRRRPRVRLQLAPVPGDKRPREGGAEDGDPAKRQEAAPGEPHQGHRDPAKRREKPFRYGNYHMYYHYRIGRDRQDPRVAAIDPAWFAGKAVLDIGCHNGTVLLAVLRRLRDQPAASAVGIEIDRILAEQARQAASKAAAAGEIATPVEFRCDNYVEEEEPAGRFDTITCFGVAKWIHLNWGDAGIKRLFHKTFASLAPGGHFLIEWQTWESYGKKAKLWEHSKKRMNKIQLKPPQFLEYLCTKVGFEFVRELSIEGQSTGFDRPIVVFRRPLEAPAAAAADPQEVK